VLGRLGRAALAREDDLSVEQAMSNSPSTVRPSLEFDRAVDRMRLLGLVERDTAEQALRDLNRSSARTLFEGSPP
jgi:hypothetical protein